MACIRARACMCVCTCVCGADDGVGGISASVHMMNGDEQYGTSRTSLKIRNEQL